MFDTPIIDSHVHLWDPNRFPMPWLDTVPALNHAFDVEMYREHTSNLPVVGMVYVEVGVAPAFALLEAQHVVEVARHDTRLRGIVAAAPTEYGERARSYLDALRELSPLIKGVRRNLQDEADASYCLRSDFMRGVTLLSEYDLSFDICVRHH